MGKILFTSESVTEGHPDKIVSEIWSHILSGCPSVTDSDVKSIFPIIYPPQLFIIR